MNAPPSPAQTLPIQTVLIVDDSAVDRAIFHRYLTHRIEQPYRVIEVDSAESGLAVLADSAVDSPAIDLVLLDYSLPGMDGLAFLQQMQASEQALSTLPPVLMLTGQGDERIAAQAIKAGAQDYIVKQQRMEGVLRLAVRTALREAALQRRVKVYQAQQVLVQDIVLRIRQSLDAKAVLAQAALETRRLLGCDRVILYRFFPDGSGIVEVESVEPPWTAIKGQIIEDSCFKNGWFDKYLLGQTTAVENIHTDEIADCHRALLAQFEVQANLVVPIVMTAVSNESMSVEQTSADNREIWGLLIAHQCEAPRQWKESEVQLLKQICDQLAIALQQSALYQQLQSANQRLESEVEARTAQLKQANAQLMDTNQALQTSNRDLEQFAYIASHDLREPLRKIRSFAELLAKRYQGEIDETGDRYINYITDGAVRMQRLINDLLAYSRIGRRDLDRVSTPLDKSLSQALETLSEQIVQTQAVIHVQPLPTLSIDAMQIEQLFQNLVENALKYSSDEPPEIKISAIPLKDEWKILIQDNGIGINPEFRDRIFTIFQRLHAKSEYSGTGIGLAICQKIVERHGGKIGVEPSGEGDTSEEGDTSGEGDPSEESAASVTAAQGSTFWFTLPANTVTVADAVADTVATAVA